MFPLSGMVNLTLEFLEGMNQGKRSLEKIINAYEANKFWRGLEYLTQA